MHERVSEAAASGQRNSFAEAGRCSAKETASLAAWDVQGLSIPTELEPGSECLLYTKPYPSPFRGYT